jgi:hypothetical protein
MAARKPSPHTARRHALAQLAGLETSYAALEGSRPRTRGKKAAKTRGLNKLKRRVSAAKGLLTKAKNAIARETASRNSQKHAAKQKRSEAARKGWAKRRVPRASQTGDVWQHLLPDGTTTTVVVDEADSSLEGLYWSAFEDARAGKRDLWEFKGLSVFDLDRQRRFPFVTDLDVIAEHAEEIDFGPGFYKRRSETPGSAA